MRTTRTANLRFFILLCLGSFSASSFGDTYETSFDCTKAQGDGEKLVCSDKDLAEYDLLLNALYKKKLKALSKKAKRALKKQQRSWIKTRDECVGVAPADEWFCFNSSYKKRIRTLDGTKALLSLYRKRCTKDIGYCFQLGKFEMELGLWADAAGHLDGMCKADFDGDGGSSCAKRALALEKVGKAREALSLYEDACKKRQNNEACAGAFRLKKKKPSHPWVGLYKRPKGELIGSLFIGEAKAGKLSMNLDTQWANGHTCSFSGASAVKDNKMVIKKKAEFQDEDDCVLELKKTGNVLTTRDVGRNCRISNCGVRGFLDDSFERDPKATKF